MVTYEVKSMGLHITLMIMIFKQIRQIYLYLLSRVWLPLHINSGSSEITVKSGELEINDK